MLVFNHTFCARHHSLRTVHTPFHNPIYTVSRDLERYDPAFNTVSFTEHHSRELCHYRPHVRRCSRTSLESMGCHRDVDDVVD